MQPLILALSRTYLVLSLALAAAVLILAVVGLILVIVTRNDAFVVIDRQKQNWLLLMAGAVVAGMVSLAAPSLQTIWAIAAVIVGIYWQDVRPAIKDALDNEGGVW